MKTHRTLLIFLAVSALTAACGVAPAEGPGAYSSDFRTSSQFFTFMGGREPAVGNSPHGFVRIYYSANARAGIERGDFPLGVGTVAIKEQSRSIDGDLEAITVMIKRANGWFYQSFAPDSTGGQANQAFCSGCHQGFPKTDSLGGTAIRK